MFITLDNREIFSLFESCLYGIRDKENASYRTNDKELILLINLNTQHLQVLSRLETLFELQFEADNITWKESYLEKYCSTPMYTSQALIKELYEEVKEKRGYRVF